MQRQSAAQIACGAARGGRGLLGKALLECVSPRWQRFMLQPLAQRSQWFGRLAYEIYFRLTVLAGRSGESLQRAGVSEVTSTNPSHILGALHPDRGTRLRAIKLARKLDINLTDVCNLKCSYCYQHSRDTDWVADTEVSTARNMGAAQIGEILRQARNLGANQVKFTGGEPFARKDIFDILTHAIELEFDEIEICTNLLLVNRERIARLASLFGPAEKSKLHFHVSIDGYSALTSRRRDQKIFSDPDFAKLSSLKNEVAGFSLSINSMWTQTLLENGSHISILYKLLPLSPRRWSISVPYLVKDTVAAIRRDNRTFPNFGEIVEASIALVKILKVVQPDFPLSIPLVYKHELTRSSDYSRVTASPQHDHPCFPCHGSYFIIGPNGQQFDCLLLSETDITTDLEDGLVRSVVQPRVHEPWYELSIRQVGSDCLGCRYEMLCAGQCPNDRWNASGGTRFGRDKSACSLLRLSEEWLLPALSAEERSVVQASIASDGWTPARYKSLASIVNGERPVAEDISNEHNRHYHAAPPDQPVNVNYLVKRPEHVGE